jgi:hypothetical protein
LLVIGVAASVLALAPGGNSKPIRVGVLVSQATVTGPSAFDNRPFYHGFPRVTDLLKNESSLELWAVIEPGTDGEDRIPEIVKHSFGGRVVHGDKVEELSKLDVVIAPHIPHTPPEVMHALEIAVRERGLGLLNWMNLGGMTPGMADADTLALAGFESMKWSASGEPVDCEIVTDHPVVGKRAKGGRPLRIIPNGSSGNLVKEATPLIRVKNPSVLGLSDDEPFYPLYVVNHGKGRIVCWSIAIHKPVPLDGKAFMLRSIQWLAQREK